MHIILRSTAHPIRTMQSPNVPVFKTDLLSRAEAKELMLISKGHVEEDRTCQLRCLCMCLKRVHLASGRKDLNESIRLHFMTA